jgi:alpha-galactosidase
MAKFALFVVVPAGAIDNGVGLTPPMGWRSWNCYGADVDQNKMESIMAKMTQRVRTVDGVNTSLLDLGYSNCGLDDNWQACGAGAFGSFHDANGNPIVNTSRFPDMKRMIDYGHLRGLRVGWYMNNCICREGPWNWHGDVNITKHMTQSARAVAAFGFDGLKLDGCGEFMNLTWWAELLNATGHPVMIENCHWGGTVPGQTSGDGPCVGTTDVSDCPYNFYRTSHDIHNTWESMTSNLHSTMAYQGNPPLSRPGAWAYPDMMEVGNMASFIEDRSHFGAWVITSSPLILGNDLNNESLTDKIWPIISNKEAIAINQAWAGHPGRQIKTILPDAIPVVIGSDVYALACNNSDLTQQHWSYNATSKLVHGPGEKCLDSSLLLNTCNGSTVQQFTAGDDETIKSVAEDKCIDVKAGGPRIQLYSCQGSTNQQFSFQEGGALFSRENTCLAGRGLPPPSLDLVEIWTKPLGNDKFAAFAMNNGFNVTFQINVSDVIPSSQAQVRDVWAHEDLGRITNSISVSLMRHDSAMYVFIPLDEQLI